MRTLARMGTSAWSPGTSVAGARDTRGTWLPRAGIFKKNIVPSMFFRLYFNVRKSCQREMFLLSLYFI